MIKRMDHINVVVSNIEQAKSFFLNLGFEEIECEYLSGDMFSTVTDIADIEANYVALSFPGAETKLELIHYIVPTGGMDP